MFVNKWVFAVLIAAFMAVQAHAADPAESMFVPKGFEVYVGFGMLNTGEDVGGESAPDEATYTDGWLPYATLGVSAKSFVDYGSGAWIWMFPNTFYVNGEVSYGENSTSTYTAFGLTGGLGYRFMATQAIAIEPFVDFTYRYRNIQRNTEGMGMYYADPDTGAPTPVADQNVDFVRNITFSRIGAWGDFYAGNGVMVSLGAALLLPLYIDEDAPNVDEIDDNSTLKRDWDSFVPGWYVGGKLRWERFEFNGGWEVIRTQTKTDGVKYKEQDDNLRFNLSYLF